MTSEERLKICEKCKLVYMDPTYGPTCDSSKYINKITGEISRIPKSGWIRGCGCKLKWKSKDPTAKCVLGKWK